ncbi:MAG: OmpA family protein [Pseudobdellovibrionaceae bacterium]|nr:OmpA family protein [Pseudobdellovibrionaceae bacterium]
MASGNEFIFCSEVGAWKCLEPTPKTPYELVEVSQPENASTEGSPRTWTIAFEFDRIEISQKDEKVIAGLTREARPQSGLVVTGYTDDLGGKEYNEKLASRRAHQVVESLVRNGYPRERIKVKTEATSCQAKNRTERLAFRKVEVAEMSL